MSAEVNSLKILVGSDDFSRRTGMPIYLRSLCRALIAKGHKPMIASHKIGLVPEREIPQIGYYQLSQAPQMFKPDVLILNEPYSALLCDLYPAVPAYNIIHSAFDQDAPIIRSQVRKYIAPKKRDADFAISKGAPKEKIVQLPIPIDPVYFQKRSPDIKWDIIAPCTFDFLRQKMIFDLMKKAKAGARVLLIGEDCGAINGKTRPASFDVIPAPVDNLVDYIAQAACVASLYEGTVAIEGWAQGKPALIYDEHGKCKRKEPPKDIEKHSSERVAQAFLNMFTELWADIVIPHHDRADLLAQCLESLPPLNFNVIVAKFGGCFSENCNAGARLAKTPLIFFLNDDTVLNPRSFWEMIDAPADIVACPQIFRNGKRANDYIGAIEQVSKFSEGELFCVGIGLRRNPLSQKIEYFMSKSKAESLYPSGAFFRIRRELFESLKGLDERFRNGGEDQDLFLRAYEQGASFAFTETAIQHIISASAQRFTHVEENEALLRKLWLDNEDRLFGIMEL